MKKHERKDRWENKEKMKEKVEEMRKKRMKKGIGNMDKY